MDGDNELVGADAAQKIILDKRLIAVFQLAGRQSDEFRSAQVEVAKNEYWPQDDAITVNVDGNTFTGRVGDVIKSEAGMATLFDRKVNLGKIDILSATLEKYAADLKPTKLEDFAAIERQVITDITYRKNYLGDASLSQPDQGVAVRASRSTGTSSRSGGRFGRTTKKKKE